MHLCTCVNEEGGDGEDVFPETPSLLSMLRYPTGLWARPVIRYRPVTGTDRITTSPARTGTGEMVHRLPVHRLVGSANDKHAEATERRVLDSITQRTHIQLNMSSEVRV